MKLEQALDPNNPGEWVLVGESPEFRHYELELGDGLVIRRTEHKWTEQLLEDNAREQVDSLNKRWGDGQVIGSIPLTEYFRSGLAEANKQGDKAFISRFWNDIDNRKFRRFGGRV